MPNPYKGSWFDVLVEDFDADDACLEHICAEVRSTGVIKQGPFWEPTFDNDMHSYVHDAGITSPGQKLSPGPKLPAVVRRPDPELAIDKGARRRLRVQENALAKRGVVLTDAEREEAYLRIKEFLAS